MPWRAVARPLGHLDRSWPPVYDTAVTGDRPPPQPARVPQVKLSLGSTLLVIGAVVAVVALLNLFHAA
jgi:hypothetical protein